MTKIGKGWSIYEYGAFGVSKKLVDLNTIEDGDGFVKVIIDGKEYGFKHANDDSNRLSGMGVVAGLFKGVRDFQYYYDSNKRAIVMALSPDKRDKPIAQANIADNTVDEAEDDRWDKEQEEIINEIRREVSGKDNAWNKYKGDITAQIIIRYLKRYLPNHLKIVGHDFFIHNNKKEYDAMVVKSNAKDFYNTYELADVACVMEIKQSGFWKKEHVNELARGFNKLESKSLLISASCNVTRHAKKKIENVFILCNKQWVTKNFQDEWKRLVDFIGKL